jgi:CTP:molybdopterin cytidylyltransferase MocA
MIAGIVLAGGASARMGRPKALLPVGRHGPTFLERVLASLRNGGLERVVVVLGGNAGEVTTAFPTLPPGVTFAANRRFERGQLSSLLVGLDAVEEAETVGVLVTLIDMPLITAGSVRAVLEAARRTPPPPIVRATYRGEHGHPVLFHRLVFGELRAADPGVGAKQVVRAHAADLLDLDLDDRGVVTDIDTPEDYERFIGPA